eukprot:CAMPEP_0183336030 /NCGR_PEP_ID=MMETSP0164_2-20130417/4136_1 /TAXON_ID=221442 /ORGANISM="Coccolithus pelagicus ssp braarudi, Strain PLY182g" /LENGTH=121 /DNA_ID=CAMNT_0025505481 /DNA_START=252 /DNA_END=613 /DNA_ORIENTATION=+
MAKKTPPAFFSLANGRHRSGDTDWRSAKSKDRETLACRSVIAVLAFLRPSGGSSPLTKRGLGRLVPLLPAAEAKAPGRVERDERMEAAAARAHQRVADPAQRRGELAHEARALAEQHRVDE